MKQCDRCGNIFAPKKIKAIIFKMLTGDVVGGYPICLCPACENELMTWLNGIRLEEDT